MTTQDQQDPVVTKQLIHLSKSLKKIQCLPEPTEPSRCHGEKLNCAPDLLINAHK